MSGLPSSSSSSSSSPSSASTPGHHALCIGIDAYADAADRLTCCVSDATDVSALLGDRFGFAVTTLLDPDRETLLRAILSLIKRLRDGDTVLFYYSGHGRERDGENYLLPRAFREDSDLQFEAVPLNDAVIMRLNQACRNLRIILMLDACRENANDPTYKAAKKLGGAKAGGGLAHVQAPSGSEFFLCFASAPGTVALQSQGRNSHFTAALLAELRQQAVGGGEAGRSVRLDDVLLGVNRQLKVSTEGRQKAFTTVALDEPIVLTAKPVAQPTEPKEPRFVAFVGREGEEQGHLKQPVFVCFNSDARTMFISETSNNRVSVFRSNRQAAAASSSSSSASATNAEWSFLCLIGIGNEGRDDQVGNKPGVLNWPAGLAFDHATGRLFVAAQGNDRVSVFDVRSLPASAAKPLAVWGKGLGQGDGQLSYPCGLLFHENRLFICDRDNHRVAVWHGSTGQHVTAFGSEGDEAGQFGKPLSIELHRHQLFITDGGDDGRSGRIQVFSIDHANNRYLPIRIIEHAEMKVPCGLAFHPLTSHLYCTDNEQHCVFVFDAATGKLLHRFGSAGEGELQFKEPAGLTFDSACRLFIAESDNHRVQLLDC